MNPSTKANPGTSFRQGVLPGQPGVRYGIVHGALTVRPLSPRLPKHVAHRSAQSRSWVGAVTGYNRYLWPNFEPITYHSVSYKLFCGCISYTQIRQVLYFAWRDNPVVYLNIDHTLLVWYGRTRTIESHFNLLYRVPYTPLCSKRRPLAGPNFQVGHYI